MGDRNNNKKRRKGLKITLICILTILFAILGFLIWQLYRINQGEDVVIKLPFTQNVLKNNADTVDSQSTAAKTEIQTAAPTTVQAETETQEKTTLQPETQPQSEQTNTAKPTVSGVSEQPQGDLEVQTYQNDEAGNMIIPEREQGSFEKEPAFSHTLTETGDSVLDNANRLAAMYDYDGAIELLKNTSGYDSNQTYKDAAAGFEQQKQAAVPYSAMSTIPHIFFHTLVADTSRAFDTSIAISPDDGTCKVDDYNYVMTTVSEFCRILEQMYENDYVLVSIYDIASFNEQSDGTTKMQYNNIYLPAGKKPFVLSVDDVSYYQYMMNCQGFASKLVIDANGKVTNEYEQPDGSVIYGSYDVVPILDDFVEAHPDFSYHGAKGIIALTGYNGILGYRTSDFWYNWDCDYFEYDNENIVEQRNKMYYNNENIEQDKQTAMQVAQAIKDNGWLFASHTWGHNKVGSHEYDFIKWDTEMWEKEVEPLIGDTDILIFPQGEDLYEGSWRGYDKQNEKYQLFKNAGFSYYCNVDSNVGWTQLGDEYYRMGRVNVDGQRMWEAIQHYANPESTASDVFTAMFDVRTVFDWSRPTPVVK